MRMSLKRFPIALGMVVMMVLLMAPFASAGISINIEVQPPLVAVPGAPVYYAPTLPYNYFFYGGRYFVFTDGIWYVGPTFRGPWSYLPLVSVPRPLLGVPVDFYRAPLHGWHRGGPPPWARHREEYREHEEHARREFEREHERREHHEDRDRREGRWEEHR